MHAWASRVEAVADAAEGSRACVLSRRKSQCGDGDVELTGMGVGRRHLMVGSWTCERIVEISLVSVSVDRANAVE